MTDTQMTPEQVRKALEAGIITPDQAKSMGVELPAGDDTSTIGQEDNMRFLRSFSDVFIGLGLIILMLGLSGLIAMSGGGVLFLAAAAVSAILADYFGRKKRAHFPTLILALAFLIFVQRGLTALIGGGDILVAFITAAAMGLFYWRIRLPFCIALIALALLYLLFAVLGQIAPGLTKSNLGVVLLLAGLAVFGAALAYDVRDTHRRTRFADNAFWLHFIAAPMIIHGLAVMSVSMKSDVLFGFVPMVSINRADAAVILVIIAFISFVGLAINRRALIVSSLGYGIFALAYLFDGAGMKFGMSVTMAFVALGAAVVFLGAGWHAARNQIIKVLPKWKVFPPPYEEP